MCVGHSLGFVTVGAVLLWNKKARWYILNHGTLTLAIAQNLIVVVVQLRYHIIMTVNR